MPLTFDQRTAAAAMGIDLELLPLAIRLIEQASDLPALDPAGRTTIFLDTKDWIGLSRARLGQREGAAYADLYVELNKRIAADTILVPLTASTYVEILSNPRRQQRADLLAVVAQISGFASLAGTAIAVRHQVRTAVADRLGVPAPPPLAPFGFGMSHAFGDRRILTLRHNDGSPLTADEAHFKPIEQVMQAMAEVKLLTDPDSAEETELRKIGYRPEAVTDARQRQLTREQEVEATLAAQPKWRSRLTDLVVARHLTWHLLDVIVEVAQEYGVHPPEFLGGGKQFLTDLVADIPSAAVHVALTEANFRNTSRPLQLSDLADADALAAAVPYCDFVMTDAHVERQIANSAAVRRLGTTVLSKPADLLAGLP